MATVTYIKETKQHLSAMRGVMRYCMRLDKTWDKLSQTRLVSGINCDGLNSILEFEATKATHGKMDGINFYQYVQSFKPTENITPQQAHKIAMEFAEKAWPGHEIQVTTHCDAAHIHSHFIINSVSFETGHKLRQDPYTLKNLRAVSDEVCLAHGFSILPKYEGGGRRMSNREWRAAQKAQSWKFRLMYVIGQTMQLSASKEDFILLMGRKGYEVKWTDERKDITFTCPNGMKCRGSRLHDAKYGKECFENEFRIRKEQYDLYFSGETDPSQWTGSGDPAEDTLRNDPLRHPGGMAGEGNEPAGRSGKVPADPVSDDTGAGNAPRSDATAGIPTANTTEGKSISAGQDALYSATGWEREREIFFRNLANALGQSQDYGAYYTEVETAHWQTGTQLSDPFRGNIGAGLRGLAAAGSLIENDSEDPEERRKRIEAEQAGSNVGAILGLAIGAALAATQDKPATEEQTIQDEQDFKEFLAQMEAEEEQKQEQTMQL